MSLINSNTISKMLDDIHHVDIEGLNFKEDHKNRTNALIDASYFGTDVSVYKLDRDDVKYIINDTDMLKLLKKIKANLRFRHPKLVCCYGVNLDYHKNYYIVLEKAQNGTLRDVILSNEFKNLNYNDNWLYVLIDISMVLHFMHCENMIHGHINSNSININGNHSSAKITWYDMFNLKRNSSKYQHDYFDHVYTSPELLYKNKYTKAGDVYAFGVLLYEIITGKIPETKFENRYKCLKFKLKIPLFNKAPKYIKKLFYMCTDENINKRPSFKYILKYLQKQLKE